MGQQAMKIAIVGAGAMGSLFAARLAGAGHAVSLVEIDERRRERIADHGLEVQVDGRTLRCGVPCYLPADLPAGQDVLVLLTKFGALRPALGDCRHALGDRAFVVVLSNGLGVEAQLADLIPRHALILGVTEVAADLTDDIVHGSMDGSVRIGPAVSSDEAVRFTHDLRDCLDGAGFRAEASPDITGQIWQKVAFNAAFNALAAIADKPVGGLDNPSGRWIVTAAMDEAVAVAGAGGYVLDREALMRKIDGAFHAQADHLPSMLQDRRAGRRTEIDAINGAIVRFGEELGVPTPVNRTLRDLVRLMQE